MANQSKASGLTLSVTATLPPELTGRLLAEVDAIARRMTRRIAEGIVLPDPRFRRLSYLRTVTIACQDAFRTLVRLLNDGRGLRPGDLDRLGSMGAQQAELGMPLEVVFGAYRVAAKVVWQELIGEAAQRDELPSSTLVAVTGQVLEYFDEISAAVGSAYLETRERLMRQRDRDRDRILQRLVAGDASDELRRMAVATDLALAPPYRVVVCRVPTTDVDHAMETAWRAAGALLLDDEPGTWIALVPAEVDLDRLYANLDGARIGFGPPANTLEEVAPAARRARVALEVGERLDPERRVHDDAELGVFAAIAADRGALTRFVERALGELVTDDRARNRDLLATIDAVLDTPSLAAAADRLGVHRHTVVYRLGRLRELGIDIDDPGQRHRLWLALRGVRLLSA